MPTNGSIRIRFDLAAGVLLLGLLLAAYWPALHGGFVWDDDAYFTYNRIRAADGLRRIWFSTDCADYWPVTSTSLWLEWRLWGDRTFGYHLTNLALHAVEAFLLCSILRRLRIPGATVAAFLFALHPVNVESVAWIAERKNLMAMLFFLLSVRLFLAGGVHRLAAFLAFVLALLSKGSVAMAPFVFLGLLAWERPLRRRDFWLIAPFFAAAAVAVAVNFWFREHGYAEVVRPAGPAARFAGAGSVVWFYLSKAILPVRLLLIYPQWELSAARMTGWLPAVAAAAVAAILWRSRPRADPFLAASAYFVAMLVPVMGFADIYFMRYSLVADHYEHLALIGVAALAGAGWAAWRRARPGPLAVVAAAGIVAALTLGSRAQAGLYRSEESLYLATLKGNPGCWLAENNLGMIRARQGRLDEAMADFREAIRLKPDFANAHSNLGTALGSIGERAAGMAEYREAIRLDPTLPDAHSGLGNDLVDAGRLGEGLAELEEALRLKPDFPEARNGLGNLLARLGRFEEAAGQYREALRERPDFPEAENNLAVVLEREGRADEAMARLRELLRRHPGYRDARTNLDILLRRAGRPSL